jgi:hypothetical protein
VRRTFLFCQVIGGHSLNPVATSPEKQVVR